MEGGEEKLISIEELIKKAKALGVDFGKGNPKNRLRYLVKLGLFPQAKRKSWNGLPSQGVYPESALRILLEIDRELKAGKSVLQLKKEMKEKRMISRDEKFEIPAREILETKKVSSFFSRFFFSFLIFSILFLGFFLVGANKKIFDEKINMFVAQLSNLKKIVQLPEKKEEKREFFSLFPSEPYLTINAETLIKENLTVEKSISASSFLISKEGFSATISTLPLTSNRTYQFPDASGVVCLSTGNCIGLGGEVFSPGGIINRLAKFTRERRLESSSIEDLFSGTSITIDRLGNVGIGTSRPTRKLEVLGDILGGNLISTGNLIVRQRVGIGTETPLYPLQVIGKIQASGDICTDLAGGKCLSEAITTLPPIGARGVRGVGNVGYLPIWTSSSYLGNSILFQTNGKIGINTLSPNEVLTLGGVLSLAKVTEPEATLGFGKIYIGNNGRLYYKNEYGVVFDLLAPTGNVIGFGQKGQVAFWQATTTIGGSEDFTFDSENKIFEVKGTVKTESFQLPLGAHLGYVLYSDNSGFGYWGPVPTGTIPAGSLSHQTLRWNGLSWVPSNFLFNTENAIGIGTQTPIATLTVFGSGYFEGPLTIATSSLAQLILQYDSDNYLKFSISSTSSEILASKSLIFNSLTGELKFFNTSLKRGDKILRASFPILKFEIPVETSSTTFVSLTKEISLNSILPPKLEGSERKFAFLMNFADTIPSTASSTWQIDFASLPDINFEFRGQNLSGSNLDEGTPHLKDNLEGLQSDNWILKVKVPFSSSRIRIFNIFLLVYDQIQ